MHATRSRCTDDATMLLNKHSWTAYRCQQLLRLALMERENWGGKRQEGGELERHADTALQ